MGWKHVTALAGGGTIALAALQGTASATPGSGVTARTIAQGTIDGTDYVLRELTIAPGGSTGWHYHGSRLRAVVTRGTLTHHASDCSVDGLYGEGDTIVEPAGPDAVHLGRNLGPTPVVLTALYLVPHGSPLAVDAPNPGCDFE
ncbi:cupin domain-containing protein [Actinomadura viridis]|uniref:Quercetin dioxygenase-like cupin family protein n=1 Tax=Actinomadura viridis TaxID=58110 RepID=A0A931DS66_9ACTN|nr:cupin domain-containing protein [Actinomadura viridis]MBG6092982.1 quercetin dioxygenase-like cupin family protein [Actinomadura viridis]